MCATDMHARMVSWLLHWQKLWCSQGNPLYYQLPAHRRMKGWQGWQNETLCSVFAHVCAYVYIYLCNMHKIRLKQQCKNLYCTIKYLFTYWLEKLPELLFLALKLYFRPKNSKSLEVFLTNKEKHEPRKSPYSLLYNNIYTRWY